MEEVIDSVKEKFDSFWYKLYADDMVVILKHNLISEFLHILTKTF